MDSKNILIVTFSPGGGCAELADAATVILHRAGYDTECLDITYAEDREAACGLEIHVDLMILISPVYLRRLPPPVEFFISRSQLFINEVALILGYGSSGVGSAPEQARTLFSRVEVPLCRILACPLSHSFSDFVEGKQELPESLGEVGRFILSVANDDDREEHPIVSKEFDIIGKIPYSIAKKLSFGLPKTESANCAFCGRCAEICPTEAITLDNFTINADRCIGCASCVKCCPKGAKSIKLYPWTKAMVKKGFNEPKYPEELTAQK